MSREKKEARLSFRITDELSNEIDQIVDENDKIKDRSDFGTKAIDYYLTYVRQEAEMKNAMRDAIFALADEIDGEFPEVEHLKELIDKREEKES